jgi:LysR family glycine cleavage system transcriptional activator
MTSLRRQIPSANALFVFEAAARAGSFTKAAAELNVTQPAVSRMLGRLEEYLGIQLFERSPSGINLTDDGRLLYRCLSASFSEIETTIRQIRASRTASETVTLSLSSAFTTHWLMPRIHHFQRAFPNVDLRFQLISGPLQGPVADVDLGMRFIDGASKEYNAWLFSPEEIIPVCSPSYLKQHGPLGVGKGGQTLLDLSASAPQWADLLEKLRLDRRPAMNLMTFSDYAVVLQAAAFGQGVALGWVSAVSYALRNGELVPAGPHLVRTSRLCHLVAPPAKPMRPVVADIRDWFLAELEADLKVIHRLYPDLRSGKSDPD